MTNMAQNQGEQSTPHEDGSLYAKPVESNTPLSTVGIPAVPDNITPISKQENNEVDVLTSAKVMVVSDDTLNAEVMSGFLQQFGYSNIISSNKISEVFDVIFNERPDVILYENTMLNEADFELLKKVRDNRTTRQIPIVILTAFAEQDTKLRALELGVIDVLIKPATSDELALRLRNILEVKSYHEHIASHDLITNLPNRESFLTRLEWALKYAKRYNTTGAVLQLGLDKLKKINDAFGPMSGDLLLKTVATRINNVLRESDVVSRAEDENAELIASKSSGDEFSILLPVITEAEDAAIVARKLQRQMMEPFQINGNEFKTTCNIGISVFPDDSTSKETILHCAIVSLHQASRDELNSYTFYSKELNAESAYKVSLTNGLSKALTEAQFSLFYQPKVNLKTGEVSGAEALLRWLHPIHGYISPVDFIPLAEESGDILAIGKWVVNNVCEQINTWQSAGIQVPRIAINISALQFKNDQLFEEIKHALINNNVDANQIDIELTESAVISNVNDGVETLKALKKMGIKISIDDFGTGYSSLSHLKKLPLNELKIDRSFVTDIGTGDNSEAIILAIISMAHSLGLNVVAEGVETEEQLNFLNEHQCNVYQGNLFSPAVPANDFNRILESEALKGNVDHG